MKNLNKILKDIKDKELDPHNLKNILNEIENQGLEIDKDQITDYLSSNRNFGYHSTPNDISRLMANIGKLYNPKSLVDLSCGLGNIIYYCNYCDNRTGFEINTDICNMAKYLFPEIKIVNTNSLSYDFETYFDAVISHFPFGSGLSGKSRKYNLEHQFIEKSISILNPSGVLICLVSEFFLTSERSLKLREQIIEKNHLNSVISLQDSEDLFNNTHMKMSIVVIEKEKSEKDTLFLEYYNANETFTNLKNKSNGFYISRDKLLERWDAHYHHPKNSEFEIELNKYQTKTIGDLAEIISDLRISKNKKIEGEYLLLHPKNIKNGNIIRSSKDYYVDYSDLHHKTKIIIQKGDIIVPRIYNHNNNKLYIHKDASMKIVAGSDLIILRSDISEYLSTYLHTKEGRELFYKQIRIHSKGAIFSSVSMSDIKTFRIPILPIENLTILSNENLKTISTNELMDMREKLESYKNNYNRLKAENKELKAASSFADEWEKKINKILENTEDIKHDIDKVLKLIQTLSDDFKDIKKLPRDDETKIIRMQQQLDSKLNQMISEKTNIDNYIQEIKIWFEFWNILEIESKEFIPQAEYLLDQLFKLDNADFSPFIIQYSRALENEILIKLFSSYHDYLISNGTDREQLVIDDLKNKNTAPFARSIQKDNRKYTIGTMNFIMGLLKNNGDTLSQSTLLQHFKNYTVEYFDSYILEKRYLKKLNRLINEYRNKAAHPSIITQEMAIEFHSLVKECLIEFIEGYKIKGDNL